MQEKILEAMLAFISMFSVKKKGQITSTINVVIFAATAIFIGIWIIMLIQNSVILPTSSVNETLAFTNNTITSTTYPHVISVTSAGNATSTYGVNNWTASTNGILFLTLAGGLANGNYWVVYDYQSTASNQTFSQAATVTWSSIQLLAIGLIVLAAAVIFAYFGFGRGKR